MAGNHPSELSPRQRMINMMYLVLTALLALNVSKEVLQSFFEVNLGIERTTTNFHSKNGETYTAFDNAALNNPEKYKEVSERAYIVKNHADALTLFIQEMKYDLVSEVDKGEVCLGKQSEVLDEKGKPKEEKLLIDKKFSELSNNQKLLPIAYLNARSNRDASGSLFLDKKRAKAKQRAYILSKQITEYKNELIELVKENQSLVSTIEQVCDVSNKNRKGKDESWEEYNFHDMPAVGALTILSKIQSDMRNIESDVINYLKIHIDAKTLKFGKAEAIQVPLTTFVLKGDSFKSEIFITAKNDQRNPDIYVGDYDSLSDGRFEMVGDYETVQVINGKGMFAKRAHSEGNKKWGGLIAMKTETGTKYYPFAGEYLVAAKTAVVAPTNMMVLYLKVPNPIKVSVPGYPASEVIATTKNGTISTVSKSKGEYIVVPDKLQKKSAPVISLYVIEDGKKKQMGSADFKIKDVPDPIAVVGGKRSGTLSKSDLIGSQMIVAQMKDFPFDRKALSFSVKSFDIVAYFKGKRSNYPTVKGSKFNDDVIEAINSTASGTEITFSNIVAKRRGVKGSKVRDLGSITFKIK